MTQERETRRETETTTETDKPADKPEIGKTEVNIGTVKPKDEN